MDEITIGDKTYISSKRASEITGYAKDYIGQLAREGYVDARKVGRSWYVYEPSIREHRFGDEEDELQAQGESVENRLESALESEQEAVAETESALRAVKERVDTWKQPVYTPEEPQTIPQTAPKPESAAFESAAPAYEELLPPAEETLTDMQAAWKEWFEQKQETLETPEIESPEAMEAREEALEAAEEEEYEEADDEDEGEEIAVPLHRMGSQEDREGEDKEKIENDEEDRGESITIRTMGRSERPVAPRAAAPASVPAPAAYEWEHAHPQAPEARIVEERVVRKAPVAGKRAARAARDGRADRAARTSSRSNAPVAALLVGVSLVVLAVAYIGSGFADPYLETLGVENPVLDYLVGTRVVQK